MKNLCIIVILLISTRISAQDDTLRLVRPDKEADELIREGIDYLNGFHGKEMDRQKAFAIFESGARKGFDICQYLAAKMLEAGTGIPKDTKKAEHWYNKSALQGNALAQFQLGKFYKTGINGPVDFKNAVKWFQKAAEKGVPNALYSMGYMYMKGLYVPQNYYQAFEYFTRAVNKNSIPGAFNLALCYENGYGVNPDPDKALKLYEKASSGGYEMATERIKKIKNGKLKSAIILPDSISGIIRGPHSPVYSTGQALAYDETASGVMVIYDCSGKTLEEIHTIDVIRDALNRILVRIDSSRAFHQVEVVENSIKSEGIGFKRPGPAGADISWQLMTIHFTEIESQGKYYLLGDGVSWSPELKEPGEKIQVVIPKKQAAVEKDLSLSEEENPFRLKAYPNPFDQRIIIGFELTVKSHVSLSVINLAGQKIKEVAEDIRLAGGNYIYRIDDIKLPGIYSVVLKVNETVSTVKIVKTN